MCLAADPPVLAHLGPLHLQGLLEEMFTLQGKSERIKNFPYPRQYATVSYQFVRLFLLSLPFAMVPEFVSIGLELAPTWPQVAPHFVWAAIPVTTLVGWLFHTMERIGRVGENPIEGSINAHLDHRPWHRDRPAPDAGRGPGTYPAPLPGAARHPDVGSSHRGLAQPGRAAHPGP